MDRHDYDTYQQARQHLEDVSADIDEETDEYLAANAAVIEAEQHVPWLLRG